MTETTDARITAALQDVLGTDFVNAAFQKTNANDRELEARIAAITLASLGGVPLSQKGVAGGVATLLSTTGKIPLSQIDDALIGGFNYRGTWNASTNTPALASGVGTKGHVYKVSTAGATALDGITDWKVGDNLIFNGATWDKIDNTDAVTSVNNRIGAVSGLAEAARAINTAARLTGGGNLTADRTLDLATIAGLAAGSYTNANITVDQWGRVTAAASGSGAGVPASEAWIVPTLLNGWLNFGAPLSTAAYYKDPLGIVHVKGVIKSGTMGSAAFALPVGYRPAEDSLYGASTSTASSTAGRVDVLANGNVVPQAGLNALIGLDSVRFRAA